jgi:triosephosphate isomerase
MRRYLIAGNWKMNTNRSTGVALASGIAAKAADINGVDLLVCPPSLYLAPIAEALAGKPVALGAQNMYFEDDGAFTGEVSAAMLGDIGAEYVILGHSERRHILGETDQEVNKKTLKALAAGLAPIVCVGEKLEEREAGQTAAVNRRQFEAAFEGVTADQATSVVIAYEPVWAIGTGKVASPEQAEEVHADLRQLLTERYNADVAGQVRILYGGSMKPGNAAELMAKPNVDGGLIGGAALKVEDFIGIAEAAGA